MVLMTSTLTSCAMLLEGNKEKTTNNIKAIELRSPDIASLAINDF
jgi:hypothetical protein